MIVKGSKVRINDNYNGNLSDVIGKVGSVVEVEIPSNEEIESRYLLDIEGTYVHEASYYPGGKRTYTSKAIVHRSEIDEFSYDMRDCKGVLLEVGDKVVYSGCRPGIIEGEVVDFKDTENSWMSVREVKKVQLRITDSYRYNDGIRTFEKKVSRFQWFEHPGRMMIVQKNMNNIVFNSKDFLALDYRNE